MKILQRIYKGACYSDKYGEHPGWPFVIFLPLLGLVAGSQNGLSGAFFGFAFFAVLLVPLFLIGCWERGK
jgi:hypothetical protein